MSRQEKLREAWHTMLLSTACAQHSEDFLKAPEKWLRENLNKDNPLIATAAIFGKAHGWSGLDYLAYFAVMTEESMTHFALRMIEEDVAPDPDAPWDVKPLVVSRGRPITLAPLHNHEPIECPWHDKTVEPGQACPECVEETIRQRPVKLDEATAREQVEHMLRETLEQISAQEQAEADAQSIGIQPAPTTRH